MEEFVDFVDNYKDSEQRVELQSQLKALEGAKDAYEEARENLLILKIWGKIKMKKQMKCRWELIEGISLKSFTVWEGL